MRRELASNADVRRVTVALVVATGIFAGGCGETTKTAADGRHQVRHEAPAYRVGQYCSGSARSAQAHLVAGLRCERHHLVR